MSNYDLAAFLFTALAVFELRSLWLTWKNRKQK
jgi:hypothetical protein